MNTNVTAETLALARAAQMQPAEINVDFMKSWVQPGSATSGINNYMLQAPSLKLFPVLTPLRNMIPRVGGGVGTQANWRAVTAINSGGMAAGVEEGKRGGLPTTTTQDYFAKFVTFGLDDKVSFQAQWAAKGFEDIKAMAALNLLEAVMVLEERMMLGGFGTVSLGTTGTPTVTDAGNSLGSLLANTLYSVIAVALTPWGYGNNSVAAGLSGQVTRTNGDGTTTTYSNGVAQKSANGTVTTANDSNNTHALKMSCTAVTGAAAYAWYVGAGAGTERLVAITTINSALIGALNGTGQLASALAASDFSANSLEFDGLLAQAAKANSGAYISTQATGTPGTGTPLTAGTDGTIAEFDAALKYQWDVNRLSPDTIWVSSQEMQYLRRKILLGSTAAAQRFVFQTDQSGIVGGTSVKGYLNPFTMNGAAQLDIKLHPNLSPGTVLMTTSKLPYPMSNVTNVFQMLLRQEYWQTEWPIVRPAYELGVYADGVMQHFFPPSLCILQNVALG